MRILLLLGALNGMAMCQDMERFHLADGRDLTGTYDAEKGVLHAKVSGVSADLPVKAEDIVSRSPYTPPAPIKPSTAADAKPAPEKFHPVPRPVAVVHSGEDGKPSVDTYAKQLSDERDRIHKAAEAIAFAPEQLDVMRESLPSKDLKKIGRLTQEILTMSAAKNPMNFQAFVALDDWSTPAAFRCFLKTGMRRDPIRDNPNDFPIDLFELGSDVVLHAVMRKNADGFKVVFEKIKGGGELFCAVIVRDGSLIGAKVEAVLDPFTLEPLAAP